MVELKALVQLENVHPAQAINYLEAYDLSIGLIPILEIPVLSLKEL
jgi:hypothetical protein